MITALGFSAGLARMRRDDLFLLILSTFSHEAHIILKFLRASHAGFKGCIEGCCYDILHMLSRGARGRLKMSNI